MSAKESNLGRNLTLVLLVSLLSAAAGAVGLWYVNGKETIGLPFINTPVTDSARKPAALTPTQPAAVLQPIFLELDPFTFTLRNQNLSRILYIGLTIQLQDEESKERLIRYMPIVRSRIITDLGDVPPEALNARETKDAIRTVAARALETPLGNESQRQLIADVLINAYVVQ